MHADALKLFRQVLNHVTITIKVFVGQRPINLWRPVSLWTDPICLLLLASACAVGVCAANAAECHRCMEQHVQDAGFVRRRVVAEQQTR